MSSPPAPQKYISVNGVMQLNPDYQRWKEATSQEFRPDPPCISSAALPVVSTMADFTSLHEASLADYSSLHQAIIVTDAVALADSTLATMEILQEPDVCLAAGIVTASGAATMFEQLTFMLAKYEVPMGLINKLMLLSEFDVLKFIIDDSESMTLKTDALDRNGRPQSRWQEAESRLKQMMEILSHIPLETIDICFLNRPDRITVSRDGRDPCELTRHLHARIQTAFRVPPQGSTPIREKLQESFRQEAGKSVARYIFCDGAPNGGPSARRHVLKLLQERHDPENNPITLISCTDQDDQVEWMKDAEERTPFCSEYDDYEDERREVLRDQGEALPFTKGFYLVAQLVGAMSPDDLDAMDECVPFTKTTLDNLLGVTHNNATYQHYYSCFIAAQQLRSVKKDHMDRPKESDELKRSFPWKNLYQEFLTSPSAKEIPAVIQFQKSLEHMDVAWTKQVKEKKASHIISGVEI